MTEKVVIIKLFFPIDYYNYNAQIWRSRNNKDFYYCGCGKYFRTLEEAENYKKEIEKEN